MLADGTQRDVAGPLLESVAIDAKAIVACQRLKIGILPGTVVRLDPLPDGNGFLFQPFCLQGCHPRMDGEACQVGNNLIAGRILVCLQQFFVVGVNRGGDGQA